MTTPTCAGSRTSSRATSETFSTRRIRPPRRRVELAHRTLDLRVPGVTDQDHVATLPAVSHHFHVDLGDERTGRVEHCQPATPGLLLDRARHAVRAEDHRCSVRHLVELLDEDRAQRPQPLDHEPVVHHLVTDVYRRAKERDRTLDDVDRAVDAGAEATRIGQQNPHDRCLKASRISSAAPTVIALSAMLNAGK